MTDFTICQSLLTQLRNKETFATEFKQYLSQTNTQNNKNLLSKVFVHFRNVLELYESIGYGNIQLVYMGIASLPDISFYQTTQWNICALTGVVSRNCFCINNDVYLGPEYKQWVVAVWTVTHISAIEKLRKQNKGISDNISDEHISLYQQCILVVLDSLLEVFPSILFHTHHMKRQLSSL